MQQRGHTHSRAQSSGAGSPAAVEALLGVELGVLERACEHLPVPSGTGLRGVTIHPPLRTAPVVQALNAAHGGRVCSTWGDFHYKTFDGDVFRFPGLCNYVFSAHCGSAYEDFNLQLRRGPGPNSTAPSRVTMKLDGLVVRLAKGSILVNGRPIQLPFSQSGVLIEHSHGNLKVAAKLGLVFMWNQDDSLLLELDAKYANQTCGLCGDFNGVPVYNEFFSHNVRLTPTEFGSLQKMDGPTEQCQDPVPEDAGTCSDDSGICEEMLSSEPFSGCAHLVNTSSYLEACRHDLCHCSRVNLTSCLCHTLAEYSRQCAHAGGLPLDWRGPQLCPQTCPLNMQYRECGPPCADTCSNPERSQLCEDHCIAGCFCPEGMVLDDIGQAGCVPVSGCSCVYNGATYAPGTGYSTGCTNCTCSGGRWTCQEAPCPGTCSVLGGAHISTFDEKQYRVPGDCSYVLAKPCDSSAFTVLAELRRCGLTDSETCLKSLTLSLGGGHTVFMVKASGEVFVNQIYTQLPVSAANVTLFRPSTFFIIAQTQLGLQLDIQLVPIMQVFVRLAPQNRGQSCGLCGNFNQNQADDFRTISGVVEGSAAAFANTWKTQAACPNVKNSFEDPCSLSVENEKYAQHWCSRLTDPHGPFAQCHSAVDPSTYYSNCLFDTCNCEKSEDCMCAALSSYVRACAARGVLLSDWRDGVCTKPMATCPKSLVYRYNISTCPPTCRARSDEDATCSISFIPVDGCTCPNGTFLDDAGVCVPAASCPCYLQGSAIPNGESLHELGAVCSCTQGTLTCIGAPPPSPVCAPPMLYVDCRNATPGASGAACQKSCHALDMDCYSTKCEPGCVCPDGLVASGDGGCVPVSACPCVHNEASYQPGQTIHVGCNTCTCQSGTWQCTDQPCLATCTVYGDGHYLTFDGRRYSFSGDCEYTLLQDHCGGNGSTQDSFRVVTENVPCGTTGTTCSKAIKIFLGSYELKLSDRTLEVIETGPRPPYSIHQMGIYLVVDTELGLTLLWDKGTSIFLRLSPEFKGRVCGLCGNFDDNALNDFTTRSQSVVGDALEFGNSWKFSPSCPDALAPRDPCTANPYRRSWAQKQCSIINSATFSACHAHVEPARYYEACVSDACACDSGGDCECFCTAVAAYAQACHDAGVCVSWRTPDTCPLFCDYYNPQGQCEWHYQPCGAPCLKTCQNPSGQCWPDTRGLEGCYPKCPPEAPIFDEDQMQCVASCPTPSPQPPCHVGGQSFWPNSTVPSDRNCYSCVCTKGGVQCAYDANACVCTYDGRPFHSGDAIYHTTDGLGSCISAHCGANGTIERTVYTCSPATPAPQTTFSFSTSLPGKADTSPAPHPHPESGKSRDPAERVTLVQSPCNQEGSGEPHTCQVWAPCPPSSRRGRQMWWNAPAADAERAAGWGVLEGRGEPRPLMLVLSLPPSGVSSTIPPGRRPSPSESTAHTPSTAPASSPGPSTPVTGPSTPVPGTSTPVPGTTTPVPGPSTPVPGTTTPVPGPSTPVPGPSTPVPGTSTPVPGPSTSIPGTTTPVPGTSTSVTGPSTPVPGTSTPVPGTTTPVPGPSTPVPGTTTPVPGPSTPVPGPSTPVPGTSTPVPGPSTSIPGTTTPVPGTLTPVPGPSTPVPGPSTPVPGTTTPVPGPSTPVPGTTTPVPGPSTPVPGPSTPIPGTSTPVPGPSTSIPGTTTPVPGTSTPVPGPSTPVPGTTTPVPGTLTPVPGPSTPVPGPSTPVPGTTTPVPGPSTPVPGTTTPVPGPSTPVPGPSTPIPGTSTPVPGPSTSIPGTTTPVPGTSTPVPGPSTPVPGPFTSVPGPSTPVPGPSTPVPGTTTPVPGPSTTIPGTSTPIPGPSTSIPGTTTPVPGPSTPVPGTSTPVPGTSTPVPGPSTPVQGTSTPVPGPSTPVPGTSTPVQGTSTPVPGPSTPVPGPSTPIPRTSTPVPGPSTPVPGTSTPVPGTSTPVQGPSTPVPGPSTPVPRTSTPVPGPSTPIPGTSTPVPGPSTPIPGTSTPVPGPSTPVPGPSTPVPGPSTLVPGTSTPVTGNLTPGKTTLLTPSPVPVSTTISNTTSVLSTAPRPSEWSSPEPTTVTCLQVLCNWTEWMDGSYPGPGRNSGDFDTISNLRAEGYKFCAEPRSVQCRAERFPDTPLQELGQDVVCNKSVGLICWNKDQLPPICYNYNIRFLCCELVDTCRTNTASPATPAATRTATAGASSAWATGALSTSTKLSTASSPHMTPTRRATPSTHEQSSPGTTPCKPKCRWTKWFDVDFPMPGPRGGDNETFSNIMRNGDPICHRSESISKVECRAENHPGVSIHELGQLVQCHQDVGLLCRNQDQKGKTRLCLNYQIRVLCCEPQEHCSPATVTVTSTSSVSTSVHTSSITSAPTPSATPVVCLFLFPAGSNIYQVTDLSGHCYYAFCSLDCHVVKGTAPTCPTSMPPPTPTTSSPESSPSTSVSVPPQGCPNAVPPRTKGETWPMPNCSEATCQGNGVITVSPRRCPRVQKPTCANGYPAVQVADRDGCCPHYQCQCVCSGWGDPHYITFDGTYYTFLDNCTYVLVQQIVPVYGHFRVLVENYFCNSEDGLSCPQSIIVEYRENRVVLVRRPVHGVMTNEIIFNGEVVRPGFQKGGIAVSQVGIKMYVSIPELGVWVMFSGLIFSVEVPFSKFANNTEGQCGTCTNDQKDECRLPGGEVVASCSNMSSHWKVAYPGQPPCNRPPPTPTPVEPRTSPTPCPPSPICQLILSKPFELCHVLIPPWPYYQGCTFDRCHMPGTDVVCSALELYAALCASLGVCIDWRGQTNYTCPFTCPAGMEYRPCGPPSPSYCYMNSSASPLALLEPSPITEGCFCPQGTMLYSSSKEVCVPTDCNGRFPGWGPQPGHTVSVDCQECTCEGGTQTMSCRPRTCPPAPACPASGQVPVPEAMQTGQCCPQYRCACDIRHCPEPEACPKGSHAVQTYREAACCPAYSCSECPGSAVPGAMVSSSLCEKCWCELPGGASSDTFSINCETQICGTSCPLGFKYQARAGQCCGECVQVACVINTSNSSVHLFYPGESWSDPGDHCISHECERHQDGLVVVTTKKACPPLNCSADKALPSEDGCCLFCPLPNRSACTVHHQLQVLRLQGCSSPGPVLLAYCRGNCGDTTSMFSPEANAVAHQCSCCREQRVSLRNVTLRCEDGSSRALTYTEVEECGCAGLQCDSPGGLGLSAVALEPSPESGLRRRGRRAPRARPLQ
uniref:Uncharacterized protein n=1 Tax=Ovis aries TaxID=9940 RepID=A0AC11C8L5_SHEEP